MKSAKVTIVHGSYGDPEENWFPWLAGELRRDGHEVTVPRFPTPDGQSLAGWLEVFMRDAGPLTDRSILVGHSTGPGLILSLLERSEHPILATFLISGFLGKLNLPDFDPINETFVCRSFAWGKIRRNAGYTKVYNSDNDPYVPLAKGEELAAHLGVSLTVVKAGGHINSAAGFTEFRPVLKEIRDIVGRAR
jgi:uncharacterized protein